MARVASRYAPGVTRAAVLWIGRSGRLQRGTGANSNRRTLKGTSNNARFRAISALAERAVAAARARVCPGSGTALMPDGDARSFAGRHTDSTPERAQAGAAAIRSS